MAMHEDDPKHHIDPIEKNIETHPVKLAIGIVVGAVSLIVGIILLVNLAIGAYAGRSTKNEPAMSDAAVTQRIAPVARVSIDPNARAPEPAKAAATATPAAMTVAAIPPAAAKGGAADGKKVYDATCTACHGTGIAGAPKLGDKAAWAPRIKAGMPEVYGIALKGKGAMPPKGGNASLSDADVKAAVDYMVAAAK
jgi:cytochrome c5